MKSLFFLPITLCLALVACASSNQDAPRSTTDANGQPVSSIPWNKPQSWEGAGQLGGLGGR